MSDVSPKLWYKQPKKKKSLTDKLIESDKRSFQRIDQMFGRPYGNQTGVKFESLRELNRLGLV